MDATGPLRVVVMGVAGSGKTTVAELLAGRLGARVLDADDAHPAANIDKMTRGIPLTDEDRQPWLERLRDELADSDRIVVTCSALRRRYRDVLRQAHGVQFVFLDLAPDLALHRLESRHGHFMGPNMIDSQFAALERPTPDETDVLTIDAATPLPDIIARSIERLVSTA